MNNQSTYFPKLKAAALLLLLTLACYWPLAFGVFSAKNDNITAFLPVRFQVSEALRHGHLPLWSPYLYLGFPVHGDMQGGAWNPLVWLISAFGRYNVTSIHAEILVYLFLSALGMYRLLGTRGLSMPVRMAGAAAYLMCGFCTDVGGSNLPFLAAAAFIPFVLAEYLELLRLPSARTVIRTALALALLFVCGYPSFLILTGYILLAALLVVLTGKIRAREQAAVKKQLLFQLYAVLVFLLVCAPAIVSYGEILPFYHRGSGVGLTEALQNSFDPPAAISLLLPPAQARLSVSADLIARNSYFNLFFLLGACSLLFVRKKRFEIFIIAGVVFFFIFSLGVATPLRGWCYRLLPLMNTFRHPANARLFVIIGGIAAGALFIDNRKLNAWVLSMAATFIIILIIIYTNKFNLFASLSLPHSGGLRQQLKYTFDHLNLADLVVISGIVQLLFLLFFWIRRRRNEVPILALVLNSFILAQLAIPFTLASQLPPSAINTVLRSYPKGFPLPDLHSSIAANSTDALAHQDTIGIAAFYNKKIAVANEVFTPTFMTPLQEVMSDSTTWRHVLSQPYAYSDAQLALNRMWNNGLDFSTSSNQASTLHLTQLRLPGWTCTIDGQSAAIQPANRAFISVSVPAGDHRVVFQYRPHGIIAAVVVSLLTLILLACWLATHRYERKAER